MAFEVGYEPALYFEKAPAPGVAKQAVARFVAFLRQNPRDPQQFRAQTQQFKHLFCGLQDRLGLALSEASPELARLRAEVARAAQGLDWPDFTWAWDSAVPLLALLLALHAGPVARGELAVSFPPPTLDTLTQDAFFDLVSPYMVSLAAPGEGARERRFHTLGVKTFLARVCIETASEGLRFNLTRNFVYDADKNRLTHTWMHRDAVRALPGGMWHAAGLTDLKFPDPCTHAAGLPFPRSEVCRKCFDQNSPDASEGDYELSLELMHTARWMRLAKKVPTPPAQAGQVDFVDMTLRLFASGAVPDFLGELQALLKQGHTFQENSIEAVYYGLAD
jgi:hypothetical protein